jgi:hypothetical protein
MRRGNQTFHANIVGVGKRCFLARNDPHTNALVDVEATRLHAPFFETPALTPRILKVEVGVIRIVTHDFTEHLFNRSVGQIIGGE